jgi:hypothetical protein
MYHAVITLFFVSKSITDLIPALAGAITRFQQILGEIDKKALEQDNAGAGAHDMRDTAEEALINVLYEVASALFAYASDANLADVKEIAGIKRSKLEHMPKLELEHKAEAISALGAKYAQKIPAYGCGPEKLTLLAEALNTYKTSTDAVVTGNTGRTGAVSTLKSLFSDADLVLKEKIDNMVNNLQASHKQFYAEYKAARVIHDMGGSRGSADDTATPPAAPAK